MLKVRYGPLQEFIQVLPEGITHFNENPGKYFKNDIWEPVFILYLR
jgi:hypothetical protein